MENSTQTTLNETMTPQSHKMHEDGRKTRLRLVFLLLSILLIASAIIFYRYIQRREPLPVLVAPNLNLNYPPHYLFSVYGLDKPVGIALSPDGHRLYVSQSDGNRSTLIFDREGNRIGEFWTAGANPAERSPVYLATDYLGQVYVVDRFQHVINIFDAEGNILDVLAEPESLIAGVSQVNTKLAWLNSNSDIETPSGSPTNINLRPIIPQYPEWSPLGIRMGMDGSLLVTDVSPDRHSIHKLLPIASSQLDSTGISPKQERFGTSGDGDGELRFPNVAVTDKNGRTFISDGNNGRISVWDQNGNFMYHIGAGSDQDFIYLPRGLFIDLHERLYVVDAVGHTVLVFDISGEVATFLFSFGDIGLGDGQFNYPNDITIDATGRIYIADRENNRIQVWSY